MYTYDETRNFIEIHGRGRKIITFPARNNDLSYEENTYYGKLLFSARSIAVLIYIDKTVHLQCILPYRCNYENH